MSGLSSNIGFTKAVSRHASVLIVAMASLFMVSSDEADAKEKVPSYVDFYLNGLKETFDSISARTLLATICESKFRKECWLTEDTLGPNREEIEELEKVSIFEVAHKAYASEQFSQVIQVKEAFSVQQHKFMSNFYNYEITVLAGYGATAEVCPTLKQKQGIAAVVDIDLRNFWGLSGSAYEGAMSIYEQRRKHFIDILEKKSSMKYCVDVRRFGALLVAIIKDRLLPYTRDPSTWMTSTQSQKFGESISSAWWELASLEIESGNKKFEHLLRDDVSDSKCISFVKCTH